MKTAPPSLVAIDPVLHKSSLFFTAGLVGTFRASIILTASLAPTQTCALGILSPNQDAEAVGRGNAFAATANNPSALYYNPAGIAQLPGHNVQFGSHTYLTLEGQYKSFTGNRSETSSKVEPVPHLYYTFAPQDHPFAYGLGLYSPFGLSIEWPEHSGFRTHAIQARLLYLTVNPEIAWRVHRTLTLAIGPTIDYSKVDLRRGLFNPTPHTDEFEFEGDGYTFGYHAGLLWQPHSQWSFGLRYRSAATLEYEGRSEYTSLPSDRTTAEFDYPQMIGGGLSYRPTPNWNIEINIDWADWNSVDTVEFKNTPLAPTLPFALNWQSSYSYHFGVSRYFNDRYFVSAGYSFIENSTSERNFTPFVPDADLHVGNVGIGFKGRHFRWALSGQLNTGPWRDVRNSERSPAGETADGRYRYYMIPAVSLSVGYHF